MNEGLLRELPLSREMKRNQTNKNKREQPVELGKKKGFHGILNLEKVFQKKESYWLGPVLCRQNKSDEGGELAVGFSNAEDADSLISKTLP